MRLKKLQRSAFTLVEMMIAVSVIGLLVLITVPAAVRAKNRSSTIALINEIRTTSDAFLMYAQEKNGWPPTSGTFGVVPTGMNVYMPKKSTWQANAPLGGLWYFWNVDPLGVNGWSSYIGVYNSNYTTDQTQLVDATLDDGNGNTGAIRQFSTWILIGLN
jgi:prepilin-type N-terminal cleavage/methylation domain-containing protein